MTAVPAPTSRRPRLAPALALALSLAAGACRSADVAEYSLSTPERALDSFKRATEADDYEHEYRSLAEPLRREFSYNSYTIGRGSFLRQHRAEVRLFLSSEITKVTYSPDRTTAVVELSAGGEVGEVVLVNEPYYEYVVDDGTGAGVESGGRLAEDVPEYVRASGAAVSIVVPLDGETLPPGEVAEFRVSRAWKFLKLLGIQEFEFEAAAAGESGAADP
jgi:hypothetical protein